MPPAVYQELVFFFSLFFCRTFILVASTVPLSSIQERAKQEESVPAYETDRSTKLCPDTVLG